MTPLIWTRAYSLEVRPHDMPARARHIGNAGASDGPPRRTKARPSPRDLKSHRSSRLVSQPADRGRDERADRGPGALERRIPRAVDARRRKDISPQCLPLVTVSTPQEARVAAETPVGSPRRQRRRGM